ncbi:unnamed protein product (macronuclear) [Paramecium tetraurelia]|uniref:Uncharacterized protein n=1 Tax=Paramecium tetraurelia TaxID=5888 RepID=A0DTQ5_PARTE|nr:uncharacterized protein GSPATT00020104001 [Paramecium tetraurelia]CAK86422.1 unnamed protein product [Paramecium tetraurelia]|eukprot:XP_001453819.1 hypothetical protein (macronuclear) [Paramecium tetraurelia strain d4-2]
MGNSESNKKNDPNGLNGQEISAQLDPELSQSLKDLDSSFQILIESTNQIGTKLNSILEGMHEKASKFQDKT